MKDIKKLIFIGDSLSSLSDEQRALIKYSSRFKNKFDNQNENEMITQFKSEKYYSNVLRKRSQGLKAGIPRESKTVTSPLGNYEKLF